MNHGDVFVLDSGKKIFVWRGSEASGMEKMTAGLIAAKLVWKIIVIRWTKTFLLARLRDHVGEDITHLEDGEEEAECDEEWTEHLPLDGRYDITITVTFIITITIIISMAGRRSLTRTRPMTLPSLRMSTRPSSCTSELGITRRVHCNRF